MSTDEYDSYLPTAELTGTIHLSVLTELSAANFGRSMHKSYAYSSLRETRRIQRRPVHGARRIS